MFSFNKKNEILGYQKKITELQCRGSSLDRSLAVIRFKPDGHILDASDSFLEVLGYTRDEVIGKHHRTFCEPSFYNSNEYKKFWQNLANGESQKGTFKRVKKEPSFLTL